MRVRALQVASALLVLPLLYMHCTANAASKKIVVAVIDTGIDSSRMGSNFLCPNGHKDFTGMGLHDAHGHGTHVSGLIDQYAKGIFLTGESETKLMSKKIDYCQIILKYYDKSSDSYTNLFNMIRSLRWAIDHKVDIINISGGGTMPSLREEALIREALDKGIAIVVAAGNDGIKIESWSTKLTTATHYFPASYDPRILVVGGIGSRKWDFNYGTIVDFEEEAVNVYSLLPDGRLGFMTGTSQATAIRTGKLVRERLSK